MLTSAGAVEVTAPRVNDKHIDPQTGERERFSSANLPPWARKTPKITEVLPLLYLHGLSSGDFVPALGQFLGSSAGLSSAVITRLTETWKAGQFVFADRDLSGLEYVYLWADGIHVNIRLEEHKLFLLVVIGVRADGRKELIALADGYRESAESWADLLRDCARRGICALVLAVGDGACRRQGVRGGLRREVPKAAAKITGELYQLLAFYDYPAEHWVHLRTTNPVNRVDLRHGQAPKQDHQGPGVEGRRPGHGVQAHRVSARPLARGERAPPRLPGPRRTDLHQRQAR